MLRIIILLLSCSSESFTPDSEGTNCSAVSTVAVDMEDDSYTGESPSALLNYFVLNGSYTTTWTPSIPEGWQLFSLDSLVGMSSASWREYETDSVSCPNQVQIEGTARLQSDDGKFSEIGTLLLTQQVGEAPRAFWTIEGFVPPTTEQASQLSTVLSTEGYDHISITGISVSVEWTSNDIDLNLDVSADSTDGDLSVLLAKGTATLIEQ